MIIDINDIVLPPDAMPKNVSEEEQKANYPSIISPMFNEPLNVSPIVKAFAEKNKKNIQINKDLMLLGD